MTIDTENQIANYYRYHIRDINKTARELSLERKQALLNEIQLRRGVCNLTEIPYDEQTCRRIEKLLSKGPTK